MRGVVGLEMPGGVVGRISISLRVGSRCAGWRVPRTSGGWCEMNEAQALGRMYGGVQNNLGIQTNGVLILLVFFVVLFFFPPSSGMELRVLCGTSVLPLSYSLSPLIQ